MSRDRDRWVPSAGGMTTALRPVMARRPGAWVGWDGGDTDVPARVEGFEADLHAVRLDPDDADGYYRGFSNRTLWPLFHDL
ncbi:MAG: trehalose-6-phosphate synthase, partial [Gemmatimonadetes bacterium]|nr:trehalose-6-phosphate synthase [Gemmatimonadota bacterium]